MSAKIRAAELQKIPYMLVCGQREADSGSVALRERSRGDLGAVKVEELIATIRRDIATKTALSGQA